MTSWPQFIVAGTMAFTVYSIANSARDDEPIERLAAVLGTIVICGVVATVLYAGGFWEPLIGRFGD